jgi:hypothetical protein
MYLKIEKASWGYEARIYGNARDDIAAGTAPTMKTAIEALRFAVAGLPSGRRRNDAIALLNNC